MSLHTVCMRALQHNVAQITSSFEELHFTVGKTLSDINQNDVHYTFTHIPNVRSDQKLTEDERRHKCRQGETDILNAVHVIGSLKRHIQTR